TGISTRVRGGVVLVAALALTSSWQVVPAAGAAAPSDNATWGALTSGLSVNPAGKLVGGGVAAISADGRYVAFGASSSKLVPGDTNGFYDVFVRDRVTGVTERVSVGPGGAEANGRNHGFDAPAISADGRYVAFTSKASNLVAHDTNDTYDVFVRDRAAQVTRRVSVGPGHRQGNNASFQPGLSANGQRVVFASLASNLVARDSNGRDDVFVRYQAGQTTRLVSVGRGRHKTNGFSFSPAISADGAWIGFVSTSSNLVAHDTNRTSDVFVRHLPTHTTRRVSVSTSGRQANNGDEGLSLSAHGRYVAFTSSSTNLVAGGTRAESNVFVRDRVERTTRRVSVEANGVQANHASFDPPSISAHGRYVAFDSFATNLVPRDSGFGLDVYVRDRVAHVTRKVSVALDGATPDDESGVPVISADGRHVVFISLASNLVTGDTNNKADLFVRDRLP
ncbi:MAG TPA: hypothetical protein VMT27_08075, partial [Actinomycetes bacterium]|nr:hypothetical protein [Actinomycetes bacterium]